MSGVPHGSVLGSTLYLLYTAEIPTILNTTATIADDTSSHYNPVTALKNLQLNLNNIKSGWKSGE